MTPYEKFKADIASPLAEISKSHAAALEETNQQLRRRSRILIVVAVTAILIASCAILYAMTR